MLKDVNEVLPKQMRQMIRDFVGPFTVKNILSQIQSGEENCNTLKDYYNLIQNIRSPLLPFYAPMLSYQKEYEFLHLLHKMSKQEFGYLTEIGTAAGGTYYLLCKVAQTDATIITIDIDRPQWRKRLLETYALEGQTGIVMKGNSQEQDTVKFVREVLNGNELDFLFIDGDHSYNGVKQDFLNYSPLVRTGGWIAFHDIVPDYLTRYGIQTNSYTGGVPKFWNEIKHKYKHFEIVEDPNQDGFGIGVLIFE